MNRRVLIVLTLAVVTATNSGCCAKFRNWLHRGSRCGTTTVAPAMMGNPVALGTPYVTPQQAPAVPSPTMAGPTMVPQMTAPQCMPQCVPQCIPMCQPQCNPCPNMCYGNGMMEVPCDDDTYFGGYIEEGSQGSAPVETYEGGTYGGNTYVPGSTFAPPAGGSTSAPGPETRANYPEEQEKEKSNSE